MTGTLRVNPRGFGFIETGEDSVFVGPKQLRGLLDGDRVEATVRTRTDADSASRGSELIRIKLCERVRTRAVADIAADGTAVVDTGMGDLRLKLRGGNTVPGSCAVIELHGDGTATITEALGDPLGGEAIARRMLERYLLPHTYAASTLAQATNGVTPRGRDAWRRNLTDQLVVTIDADESQDLDDALAAEAGPDGSVRVFVHIADVAAHVAPGTPIDAEAAATPTSVYLPGKVRHMLPPQLSADALSLLPGVERDVVTVEMRIDPVGVVRSVDVYEARIRSARRLSYTTVARILDNTDTTAVTADQLELIRILGAAAVRLGRQRLARGGVDAWRADPDPVYAGDDDAHMLVERLMVATNEAVAAWLAERGMPVLARIHPAPDDTDAAELEVAGSSIGLFSRLPRPVTPAAFAALAEQASKTRQAQVFWDVAMKVLNRATYTTADGGHFGLGSARYLHFTSPLRRYADLLVHRVVKSYLSGERSFDSAGLETSAAVINIVTQRADHAERDARRAVALKELKPRQKLNVTVLGRGRSGRTTQRVLVGDGITANLHTDGKIVPAGARVTARVRSVDALTGQLELRLDDTKRGANGDGAAKAGTASRRRGAK